MIEDVSDRILATTSRPGMMDRLGHAESAVLVRDFVRTPGIDGTAMARELAAAAAEDPDRMLSGGFRRAAERIRDHLFGRPHELVASEPSWLTVGLHVLQCPEGDDTEASLQVERATTEDASCRIEIMGLGGGPSTTFSFSVQDTLELGAGESATLNYEIGCTMEQWAFEEDGETHLYPRLGTVNPKLQRVQILGEPHRRPQEWGEADEEVHFDHRSQAEYSRRLTIDRGVTKGLKLGVKAFGATFAVESSMDRSWKTVNQYKLEPGHRYVAQRFMAPAAWWVARV